MVFIKVAITNFRMHGLLDRKELGMVFFVTVQGSSLHGELFAEGQRLFAYMDEQAVTLIGLDRVGSLDGIASKLMTKQTLSSSM